jgi:hypothetical protein
VLHIMIGTVSRPHISFRWRMNNTGRITIIAVGFRLSQIEEGLSILYRMGYCFVPIYTNSLMCISSRLIQTYVFHTYYKYKITNHQSRIGIRLYTLVLIVKGLLESILINDFLMIRKDHQMSFFGGIFDKRFLLI